MSVFALMAKHVHAPFLNLAWLGLPSVLSSVLVLSLLCWSHTQKSVKISAAIESMMVVFDCSALQNLQSVRRYKHAVKNDCFSSKPPAKTPLPAGVEREAGQDYKAVGGIAGSHGRARQEACGWSIGFCQLSERSASQ